MQRTRATGLTALIVLGGLAGFFVASTALGSDFEMIGSAAEPGTAYAVDADPGMLRFKLSAADDAVDPLAAFALYGADDTFIGYFELTRDWPTEDVHVAKAGSLIVVLYEVREAELQVAGDENSLLAGSSLTPVKTTEKRVTIVEATGDAVKTSSTVTASKRPAQAVLEYSGTIRGLDATVETSKGTVLALDGISANTTDGETHDIAGVRQAFPENLAPGAFRIRLTADSLDGTVDLVLVNYVRDGLPAAPEPLECEAHDEDEDHDASAQAHPTESEEDPCRMLVTPDGLVMLETHAPIAIDVPSGVDTLSFTFTEMAMADVSIYNEADELVDYFHLGGDLHGRGYMSPAAWTDYRSYEVSDETVEVSIDGAGEYVVYLRGFAGDEATVQLVGATDAPEARILEISSISMGENRLVAMGVEEYTVTMERPLLDLYVGDWSWADLSHNLQISSPAGGVVESYRHLAVLGIAADSGFTVTPENFVEGDYLIQWEGNGAGADLYLEFLTFEW